MILRALLTLSFILSSGTQGYCCIFESNAITEKSEMHQDHCHQSEEESEKQEKGHHDCECGCLYSTPYQLSTTEFKISLLKAKVFHFNFQPGKVSDHKFHPFRPPIQFS